MCTTQLQQAPPQDAFAESFVNHINSAAVVLMSSIGHRTGLFDVMSELGWVSSEDLAEKSGLNERYVREWLGAMATGGVVEVTADNLYRLPPEHAAFLTKKAGADNMAAFAQYVPLLASVEDDIIHCFHHGGGVPYERYPRFHEVMAEDSGVTVLPALESTILPLVPGLIQRLERGIRALDVGCGRGLALITLARRFPQSDFVGIDLSADAISWATARAAQENLPNVRFEVVDATDFDVTAEPEQYDLVTTFDAVHDQADPAAVLRGIARTLKADGVYIMQDIHSSSHVHTDRDHPFGPLMYTVSCMHCMTVSLAQGGVGLGAMWGRERAKDLLHKAGFTSVDIHQLEHDPMNDYYIVRK